MTEQSDAITKALNRIEGQVRGIRKMYEEGRDCEQIAQQVGAVMKAIKRVGTEILTSEVVKCSKEARTKDLKRVMESLVKIS
jgi:DNA-binding FrmR family transcriptional regulator